MSDEAISQVAPVLSRDPQTLPGDLPRGAEIPDELDPFADGILLKHQVEWLQDQSDMKLAEKGRRTGITFAEALDDMLIAASTKEDGGSNVFYIGDTKDKGREFIGYVAHFAKVVARETVTVEEFLFEDMKPDGSSAFISAFRAKFASGFRIEALSSRPENIRGLQGVVVIDEAAFHKDVRSVLDAVNALLIWGGKIRVISTHNGVLNPFNELIREAKAGKVPFKVHFIPFQKAVENGLFKRVCAMRNKDWSAEDEVKWEKLIRSSYGARTSAMEQELDCIPSEAEGAALTRVQIEACMEHGIPVIRWSLPDSFKNAPEHIRKADCLDFCETKLKPILEGLDPTQMHALGQDFARSGDVSGIVAAAIDLTLVRRCKLILEMRNVPFDQQRDVVFYIGDRLPRLVGAAFDATGNGAYLAEKAAQKWGEIAAEVKFTAEWYRINMPPYIEAFADRTIILPYDEDTLKDHQSLAYVNGIIRVPDDMRFKGADGNERHGDTAIAGALMWFASLMSSGIYAYTPVSALQSQPGDFLFPETITTGRRLW